MKYKALVTSEVEKSILSPLEDRVEFEYAGYCINHVVMDPLELKERVKDIDILICEYDTVSREIIQAAKNLKIIICCRGGVKDVIDLEAAMENKIIVCNNAGRNASAVADMVMGYIIDLTRNISMTNKLIHDRKITAEVSTKPKEYVDTVWGLDNDSPFIKYRGKSINHLTLGLIGYGHAGKMVAQRARAFGMKILIYDPYLTDVSEDEEAMLVSFEEIISKSDVISLHCVLTPQTKNMFTKKEFDKFKDGAYFINTARGELLNEDDLIDALQNGKLSGAAIDVTLKEPIASDSKLLDCDNLIITPHIAGSAYDVQYCGSRMVFETLNKWLNNEKPDNCVVYY